MSWILNVESLAFYFLIKVFLVALKYMYRRQLLVLALYVCNFLFYIVFIYWNWGWNVSIWWRIFIRKNSWGINFPICSSRQVGNLSKHNCWYQYWQLVKIFIYVGHYGIFLSLLFSKICTYVSLFPFWVVLYWTISFFKVLFYPSTVFSCFKFKQISLGLFWKWLCILYTHKYILYSTAKKFF